MYQQSIRASAEYQKLLRAAKEERSSVALFGLPPAGRAQFAAALSGDTGRKILVITADEAAATRFAADAAQFGAHSGVYPARDLTLREVAGQNREYEYRRLKVLGDLAGGRIDLLCASLEAALQYTCPKEEFCKNTLTLKPGMTLPLGQLTKRLTAAGYHRREQVEGAGQFSVRGGIVDIYAPDMRQPARLEYWGDEIDSIHTFDILTQRREEAQKKIYLSPAREVLFGSPSELAAAIRQAIAESKGQAKGRLEKAAAPDLARLDGDVLPEAVDKYLPLRYPQPANIFDYFDAPLLLLDEPSALREAQAATEIRTAEEIKSLLEEGVLAPPLTKYAGDGVWFRRRCETAACIYCENFARSLGGIRLTETVSVTAHALPPWPGDVAALAEELRPLAAEGYFCMVLTGTARAGKALVQDLQNAGFSAVLCKGDVAPRPGAVAVAEGTLTAGVEYPFAKFALFSGRQGAAAGVKKARKKGKGLSSLEDLKPGDYVVHQTHGIGRYLGIERLDLQGVVKDYLKLAYDKGDTLYVPVTQLDIVSRYTAPGDNEKVKLARLGGGEWNRTRSRVKQAAAEMAEELIALYAKRGEAKGYAFPPDDDWQRNFETRFEYDETEDQLLSSAEIKRDMEKPHPMDRLLCGDVGVGKTEVALRAAFKCIMGGKQCAILVPTTILAWQHYNTILRRMESFPVRVELLSRFRTPKQQKETIRNLADGTADIVVGTHRLLQNDIHFKALGLVVIDEEQRFGVKHKEKLKESFLGVDVLTLSATPIPRTLNMAMSGIRDMSSIEQPPIERQPIETYVMEYDPQVVKGAILKELGRAGQVYYLHNRIDTIEACAQRVSAMAPGARVAVAHGRMTEEQLSRVWRQVMDGEVDILVCTTIIETGVDVRNCNTLIIENADRMGLAQLYQIRGRVGRSGRKAYAYFTFQPDKVLTDVAAKRLSAIREFTSFGSGLRIAMRDLQIRGVGSLLGQSQHGHMQAVGYDLYMKILGQAVAQAKGEAIPADKAECLIDVRADAYLPEGYIPSTEGRIEAYKRIAAIESPADAEDVLAELCDRYGKPPASAKGLVDISLARVQAAKLGIYEIVQRQDALLFYSDRLKLDEIKPVLRSLDRRIMVNASAKPYLSARILPGEKPLAVMGMVLDKMCENTVKPLLKTGQSAGNPV